MIRRPPRSTRTDTLFPYTTLFRSVLALSVVRPLLRSLVSTVPAPVANPMQVFAGAESVDPGDGSRPDRAGAGALQALPTVGLEQKAGLAQRMVNEDARQVANVINTWLTEAR